MESVSPESAYARRLWSRFEAHVPSERPDESSEQEQDWSAVEDEGADALSLPATAEEAGALAVAVQQRELACADECVQRLEEHIEALNRRRFFEAWNEGIERYKNGGRNVVQSRVDALEEAIADYHSDVENNLDLKESLRDVRKRARAHERADRGDKKGDSDWEERPGLALLFSCMTWGEVMRQSTWNEILERADKLLSKHEEENARLSRLLNESIFRYNVLSLILDEDVSGVGPRRVALPTDGADPETPEKGEQSETPITGHRGPEYAKKAKEILEDSSTITTFSDLASEMEEPTVGGGSKVDTVKRNIGYDDLPKDEKTFPRFREMLRKKVNQLKGEG